MVIRKRKKNSRAHGQWTHGWGAKKKHRGTGNRGGRGNAGSGKRADCKKPRFSLYPNYFGKHGFVMHGRKNVVNAINLSAVENYIGKWIADKKASEAKGEISVDLGALGYTKLLGNGRATKRYIITVDSASKGAVESIEEVGGKVITKNGVENTDKQSS